MGSGVAKALYLKWPEVKREYHKLCSRPGVTRSQLFSTVQYVESKAKVIANAFSQYYYGNDGRQYTDYKAVGRCFMDVNLKMGLLEIDSIAMPFQYGCGLDGGDWDTILGIMEKE